MELPFFTMKVQKRGLYKYIFLIIIPTIIIYLLTNLSCAVCVFLCLAIFLLLHKNHSITVFQDTIIEKDDRGRFSRKVYASQICYYHRNFLDEIILVDADSKRLLCIESNMSNRDRFEEWLAAHYIETK